MEMFNTEIRLTPKQQHIYKGLKSIGNEIAAFYLGGLRILNCNKIETTSNLLGHISREIEGSLRDILAIKKENYTKMDSICSVLGVNKDDPFAIRWYKVSKDFHSFAHRHGAWKSPRKKEEFIEKWIDFEDILYQFIGKYYNLLDVIDKMLKYDEPTRAVIGTLSNLLRIESRNFYFFNNLKSSNWFIPLKNEGYFNPKYNPKVQEGQIIKLWPILRYLLTISESLKDSDSEYIKEILDIIRNVTIYKDAKGKHIDNYHTWHYFIKILWNIPNDYIRPKDLEMLKIWLDSKFDVNSIFQSHEIAKKLLPKFLDTQNPEDFKKAEKIFEVITDTKLSEKTSHFTKEYKILINDYDFMKFFNKYSEKFSQNCSNEIVYTIADRLVKIIRKENNYMNFRWRKKKYRININVINANKFKIKIGLLKTKKPRNKENEIKRQVEEVLGELKPEYMKKLVDTTIECNSEIQFIDRIKNELKNYKEFKDLKDEISDDIKYLYKKLFRDYSYIWYKNLFSTPDRSEDDAKSILTHILKIIIFEKVKKDKKFADRIFKDFISDKYMYPVFQRILLYLIGSNWTKFKNNFINLLNSKYAIKLFGLESYKSEIGKIFQDNFKDIKKFPKDTKNKIRINIDGISSLYPDVNKKEIAKLRQENYSLFKSDPYFQKFYEECKKITGRTIEFRTSERIRTIFGPRPSHLTKEKILNLDNEVLAKRITDFEQKDGWDEYTYDSLGLTLQIAVEEKPEKILDNYKPFLGLKYLYIGNIIRGYEDAWQNRKVFDWGKLFKFIFAYISQSIFGTQELKIQDTTYESDFKRVVENIGSLIQAGTQDDAWAFDKKYNKDAKKILLKILGMYSILHPEKRIIEKEDEYSLSDALSIALNSPYGKLIESLIVLALRIARNKYSAKSRVIDKWDIKLKEKYNELLDKNINEAYTWLGNMFPQLFYLDENWTISKFKTVNIDHKCWIEFVEGYLLRNNFNKKIYDIMKKHYLKTIKLDFGKKQTHESIVEHICIAYLRDYENLQNKDSLFRKLVLSKKRDNLPHIIWIFTLQSKHILHVKDKFSESVKQKIFDFWKWIHHYKILVKRDEKEKILSDLIRLTAYFDKIDNENIVLIKRSAPFAYINYNVPDFIKELKRIIEVDSDNIEKVSEIYPLLFEKEFVQPFEMDDIRFIVEKIYGAGFKDNAEKICNLYGERGYDFLRDIWKKYNKNND